MQSFNFVGCLLDIFYDYMSKLFKISKLSLFLSFKIQSFSFKHKLRLFDPPVYEIGCFNLVSKKYYLYYAKYEPKTVFGKLILPTLYMSKKRLKMS